MAIVYWIRSSEHVDMFTQGYIGVTSRALEDRVAEHIKVAGENHKRIYAIHRAIRSIGIENLVCSVVIFAEEDYCYEVEARLRPEKKIGWNIAEGGSKPPSKKGFKHSEESKEKISKIWKGKKRSPESVEKSANSRRGLKRSQESVEKTASKNRGRKQSQETIDKRLSKVRGQTRTEEQKKKFSEARLSKNPWEIKPANIETWAKADIYYEYWLEEKSPYKVARRLGLKHKTLAAMWRWFDNGYNPSIKEEWLKTFKEESFGT